MTTTADLPIQVERFSSTPLHRQLADQLRSAIRGGSLRGGTRLPSTRTLGAELRVARNVVVTAYEELLAEGYLRGRRGSGTFVAEGVASAAVSLPAPVWHARWLKQGAAPTRTEQSERGPDVIEFRVGLSDVDPLPQAVWRRLWSAVAADRPPTGYGPPAGDPELRSSIASYLGRARGIACDADDVVITSGASHALDLVTRVTLRPEDAVGLEEPGYPAMRNVLMAAGARMIPLPVDDDGLRVERLPGGERAPLLVYVTPSHQYPIGARMSVARRLSLLAWAAENDSLIIEDDYDSEFRFGGPPLPALAGMDRTGRVVYVGTFSKVLSPALRAGYLVAPGPLRDRVLQLKEMTEYHTPWPIQRALAAFIAGGHLERHIRRMRRHYAEKRAALAQALAPTAAVARLTGLEAGLHACLEFLVDLDPVRVASQAASEGVIVTPLDAFYLGLPDRRGLVLGYGSLTLGQIHEGGARLTSVLSRRQGP